MSVIPNYSREGALHATLAADGVWIKLPAPPIPPSLADCAAAFDLLTSVNKPEFTNEWVKIWLARAYDRNLGVLRQLREHAMPSVEEADELDHAARLPTARFLAQLFDSDFWKRAQSSNGGLSFAVDLRRYSGDPQPVRDVFALFDRSPVQLRARLDPQYDRAHNLVSPASRAVNLPEPRTWGELKPMDLLAGGSPYLREFVRSLRVDSSIADEALVAKAREGDDLKSPTARDRIDAARAALRRLVHYRPGTGTADGASLRDYARAMHDERAGPWTPEEVRWIRLALAYPLAHPLLLPRKLEHRTQVEALVRRGVLFEVQERKGSAVILADPPFLDLIDRSFEMSSVKLKVVPARSLPARRGRTPEELEIDVALLPPRAAAVRLLLRGDRAVAFLLLAHRSLKMESGLFQPGDVEEGKVLAEIEYAAPLLLESLGLSPRGPFGNGPLQKLRATIEKVCGKYAGPAIPSSGGRTRGGGAPCYALCGLRAADPMLVSRAIDLAAQEQTGRPLPPGGIDRLLAGALGRS